MKLFQMVDTKCPDCGNNDLLSYAGWFNTSSLLPDTKADIKIEHTCLNCDLEFSTMHNLSKPVKTVSPILGSKGSQIKGYKEYE